MNWKVSVIVIDRDFIANRNNNKILRKTDDI